MLSARNVVLALSLCCVSLLKKSVVMAQSAALRVLPFQDISSWNVEIVQDFARTSNEVWGEAISYELW